MAIKAVLHRLIVKPVALEVYDDVSATMKKMGLIVAPTAESKFLHTQIDQGYVLDVGPTAFLDYVKKHDLDIPVSIGSLVTYARHSGKTIRNPDDNSDVVVLNDDDILVVYTKE